MAAKKRGRKSKYESCVEPRLYEIKKWARDGCTEAEMCVRLGVSESSFNDYKKQFPEFSESLKEGKAVADYRVEDALYKRAVGFSYVEDVYITEKMDSEEREEYVSDSMELFDLENPNATKEQRWAYMNSLPNVKKILAKSVVKTVAPDTTAAIFWLKNRNPSHWRDKQNIEHSGEIKAIDPYANLTEEELRRLAYGNDNTS